MSNVDQVFRAMGEFQDNGPTIKDRIKDPVSVTKFEESFTTSTINAQIFASYEYIFTRIRQVTLHEVLAEMYSRIT